MSVAYSLISLRVRLFGPGILLEETPRRRTESGVQITSKEEISSMKTPGFGLTRATWVMTSGWSTKELSSWLESANELLKNVSFKDAPVRVVPQE